MSRNPIKGRKFIPYREAKKFALTLGLKSSYEWREWCKSVEKPSDIPTNPPRTYKSQWESWGDWLGSGRIADQYRVYRTPI